MEKMPGHTRLYRRGAVYYHRAAIPEDIKETYPKTEETFSLGTKDHNEALRLVRIAAVEVDLRFDAHRKQLSQKPISELSDQKIKELAELYLSLQLGLDEQQRVEGLSESKFNNITETTEAIAELWKHNYARGEINDFQANEVDDFLASDWIDFKLQRDSDSWYKLARKIQESLIRYTQAVSDRQQGEIVETPDIATPSLPTISPTISHVAKEWLEDRRRAGLALKTIHEYKVWISHFIDISGDRPITEFKKADGRAFKEVLVKLPKNWNKRTELKALSLSDAAEKAHKLQMPSMSVSNINKILSFVRAFWGWAENQYDDCPRNPIAGLIIKRKVKPYEERDPFTNSELQSIFTAPIYTGCKSKTKWKTQGNLILTDTGKYWVPLIGLFTGARLGEIIQLNVEDIKEQDSILYFDINKFEEDTDKTIKNSPSYRIIPIHKTLIEVGFLNLVDLRHEQNEQRLFPELKLGADGYFSSPFSKHFSRFLKSIGVKQRKNSFHSFRHNFEDACRNSEVTFEAMNFLQGHSPPGQSSRYGSRRLLHMLSREMEKITYAGLELSHLERPDAI